jgi:myo-inositol 2-dehydrogenase/D-chiro-inositol 1-dehydrogenase
MVSMGDQATGSLVVHGADGRVAPTVRGDTELFLDAYTGEFEEFVAAVREGRPPAVTGEDARRALAVALACIESEQRNAPVAIAEVDR